MAFLNLANNIYSKRSATHAANVKHLLTGKELSAADIENILCLAENIKRNPSNYQNALEKKALAMIFEKPSFRTRLSFNLAIETLGGIAVESISNTRKTEEPKDFIRVLNGYCDFVMVRTHADEQLQEMAQYATIPIINGLTALYHPCQILADLLTLKEHFGKLNELTLTYIGDGNNILHSLLIMAPRVGITLHYCCPKGHDPDATILSESKKLFPGQIHCFTTPTLAVQNVHAIYTDVWVSMGFEGQKSQSAFDNFQVNEALMSQAKPGAVFMHCMPMERGKEVSTTLPDSPQSIIFRQSENRLHIQKAILLFLDSLC
ncbi:ornithine carbamoyltransferase [Legionella gresilensis]|uniref:ornithine carbamoyltransferase n=1 Tax=Legionella gresilensis TaxID=91823 RepID=UPI001041AAC5|nr:ornithine carbamoyltransferase [Legionella gresilensis]